MNQSPEEKRKQRRTPVEISVKAKIIRAEESLGPLVLSGMIMDLSPAGAGVLLFKMTERDYRHIVRYRATKLIKLRFQLEPDPEPILVSGSIIYLDFLNKVTYTACGVGVAFDELDIEARERIQAYLESPRQQEQHQEG